MVLTGGDSALPKGHQATSGDIFDHSWGGW